MKNSTTKFWVQANENGVGKNVPHTGKKIINLFNEKQQKSFFLNYEKTILKQNSDW